MECFGHSGRNGTELTTLVFPLLDSLKLGVSKKTGKPIKPRKLEKK
jgi:hypothetical protein